MGAEHVSGVVAGEPSIQFHAHRVRAGEAGAREDFEQMIGLLVRAIYGEGALADARRGDWGIDAFVGDLNGQIRVWQAKYFMNGVAETQQGEIRESIASVARGAQNHGYRVDEWILCVPVSLTPEIRRWWDGWRVREMRKHGISIDLWDETRLRELLLRPEAAHVRRHYYEPYGTSAVVQQRSHRFSPVPDNEDQWTGGQERCLGQHDYLLRDGVVERIAPDRSWMMREITADRLSPASGRVRIRQVTGLRDNARNRREELRKQAALLRRSATSGRPLPAVVDLVESDSATTLVTAVPSGYTWARSVSAAGYEVSTYTAALVLGAAADIAEALAVLHSLGASHRQLDPESIIFAQQGGRAVLLDAGLAGFSPLSAEVREAGTTIDVRQLATLVCTAIVGFPPSPIGAPSLAALLPAIAGPLDELIARCFDASESDAPPSAHELARAFRAASRAATRGGVA